MKSLRLHFSALTLLVACVAFFPDIAAAQSLVNCAPSTPCVNGTGPYNTNTGDRSADSFGKINGDLLLLPPQLFAGTALPVNKGGTGVLTITGPIKGNGTSAISAALAADIYGPWSGTCSASTFLRGDGSCQTPSGGGNMSNSGTPTQYQTSVFGSATTILGVGPGTTGQAYASTGATSNPGFTSSLSGVTSVNSSTVPASTTLAGLSIAETWAALQTITNSDIALLGSSTGATTFTSANARATNHTLTFPAITDTLVTLTATQTLTNMSISSGQVTGLGTFATANAATPPAIGGTTPAAGAFTTLSASSGTFTAVAGGVTIGTPTGGAEGAGTLNMTGCFVNGVACGTGGSTAWSAITGGTNSTAAMVVGTGASLATSGSGTITATNTTGVNGAAVPASAAVLASNGSNQLTALTLGNALAVSSSVLQTQKLINAQVGTTYTVASTDAAKLVTFTNASAIAVTLPQATGSFAAGFTFDAEDKGAGTVTITPTTSTINGAATLTLPTNNGCTITSDGTNYQVSACTSIDTATFTQLTSGTNSTAAMLVGTGASLGATGSGTLTATAAPFSGLTTGSNTTATMTVGTGGTITVSGTGVNNANQVNGATVPASAAVLASNGSSQATALTLGNNLAVSSGVLNTTQLINAQTGTSYAIASTDAGKLITASNASAQAYTLVQATTAGFTAGYSFDIQNKGAGTVTITPTTSTINGSATLVLTTNQGCTVTSDGANYQVSACTAVAPGGSSAFSSLTTGTNTTAAMTVGTGGSLTTSGSGTITATAVPFSGVSGATNANALVVGTGGSLATSGSGTIAATSLTILTGLPTIANNTLLANVSGSTASPSATSAVNVVGLINSPTCNAQTGTTYTTVLGDGNGSYHYSECVRKYGHPCRRTQASPIRCRQRRSPVEQLGAGLTTIAQGAGVTFTSVQYGSSTTINLPMIGIYDFIQLKQTATNTWLVTVVGPGRQVPIIDNGTKFTLGTGTGACATSSTLTGGSWHGKFPMHRDRRRIDAAHCAADCASRLGVLRFRRHFGCWLVTVGDEHDRLHDQGHSHHDE